MCQAVPLLYYVEWVGAIEVSISLLRKISVNIYNWNAHQERGRK